MVLSGQSVLEVSEQLAQAWAEGRRVSSVGLDALNRILEHTPEDMTVSVEAGMTLAALQEHLGRQGQWLPLDPPRPDRATIGQVISHNLHGPRRYGYGTVREHLIGLTVVLADGRIVQSGGRVVKNVAGYDLCKLFVGDQGSIGVVVEARFKLRPKPEAEALVEWTAEDPALVQAMLERVRGSALDPVVLDLHGLAGPSGQTPPGPTLVLGFAGTSADVAWQLAEARKLGLERPSSLAHEERFWALDSALPARSFSVLPSDVVRAIGALGGAPWVARAGNGCVWHRGAYEPAQPRLPVELFHRLKQTFDAKNILPAPPW